MKRKKNSDFAFFNTVIPVISGHPIEKQFQNVYTNRIFKLLQDELRRLMFCNTSFVKQEGSILVFEVEENILGKEGATSREVSFKVQYTEVPCYVNCLCCLFEFEFRGILCRHVISVLF